MENKEITDQAKDFLNHNSEELSIKQKIYEIRDCRVMIDKDLAFLYGVETKALNQAVKRNIERFPSDFHFQLTMEECLRSQIVTLNEGKGKHLKYLPYAFTENGIAMLSSVLRSSTVYHVGASIKDLGKKWFAITLMKSIDSNEILKKLI